MISILCGKSSCGKNVMLKALTDRGHENIVTYTTRPKREGEVDGQDYFFVSRSDFERMIGNHEMVEYRKYYTLLGGKPDIWFYGNRKRRFDKYKNYVIILDLDGAKAFKKIYPDDCIIFYIDAPDEKRVQWAQKRGSFDLTEWNRRFEDDRDKFSESQVLKLSDVIVPNNGTPEDIDYFLEIVESIYSKY